jgi:hypothetical protein
VSSLVCGGASALLVRYNGGQVPVQAILKSAVVNGTLVLTSSQLENQNLVGVDGNVLSTVQAYGSFGADDSVWTVQESDAIQVLGVDNQPVTFLPVLGSALVP